MLIKLANRKNILFSLIAGVLILLILWFCFWFNKSFFNNEYSTHKIEREKHIANQIRCLVCSGETVYSSGTYFAKSVRSVINKLVDQGKTDEYILNYLASKYGEQILLNPRKDGSAAFIWWVPAVFLLIGITSSTLFIKKNKGMS